MPQFVEIKNVDCKPLVSQICPFCIILKKKKKRICLEVDIVISSDQWWESWNHDNYKFSVQGVVMMPTFLSLWAVMMISSSAASDNKVGIMTTLYPFSVSTLLSNLGKLGNNRPLGTVSISDKSSYREILWRLKAARLVGEIIVLLWNSTGPLVALLPRCLLNFRTIRQL